MKFTDINISKLDDEEKNLCFKLAILEANKVLSDSKEDKQAYNKDIKRVQREIHTYRWNKDGGNTQQGQQQSEGDNTGEQRIGD